MSGRHPFGVLMRLRSSNTRRAVVVRLDYHTGHYEVLEAQQQLYKALGGGWNLADARWTGPTR